MPIRISSSIEAKGQFPLDDRVVVNGRNTIDVFGAYQGMIVYDTADGGVYALSVDPTSDAVLGRTTLAFTNNDWVEAGSGITINAHDGTYTTVSSATFRQDQNLSTADVRMTLGVTDASVFEVGQIISGTRVFTGNPTVLLTIEELINADDADSANDSLIVTYVDGEVRGGRVVNGGRINTATFTDQDVTSITNNSSVEFNNGVLTVDEVLDENSGEPIDFWIGTIAEYDAIAEPDPETVYYITDDDGGQLATHIDNNTVPLILNGLLEPSPITVDDDTVNMESSLVVNDNPTILRRPNGTPVSFIDGLYDPDNPTERLNLPAGSTSIAVRNHISTTDVGDYIFFQGFFNQVPLRITSRTLRSTGGTSFTIFGLENPTSELILGTTNVFDAGSIQDLAVVGPVGAGTNNYFYGVGRDTIHLDGDFTNRLAVGDLIRFRNNAGFATAIADYSMNPDSFIEEISFNGTQTIFRLDRDLTHGSSVSFPQAFVQTLAGYTTINFNAHTTVEASRDLITLHSSRVNIDLTDFSPNIPDPAFTVQGMKTGTLANPPATLVANEIWADTTDSTTNPILRIHQ